MTIREYKGKVEQEAIKYCKMGFYPICKTEDGDLTILTPLVNEDGEIVTSEHGESIENPGFTDWLSDEYNTLVSIEGFWNPPFELFKVGDLVRFKDIYNPGFIQYNNFFTIERVNELKGTYTVSTNCEYPFYMFEPYIEKNLKPVPDIKELSLQEIADKFNIDINQLRIKE
jgi:hypothetical protein